MMSNDFHPGPKRIGPGCHPGGVVIHVYGAPSAKLLTVTHLSAADSAQFQASIDHDKAQARLPKHDVGFCLVAFDGDDGHRFTAEDWT
jgi:hypothetical protein